MKDYLLLMHDDAPPDGGGDDANDWVSWIAALDARGCFVGGSEIGKAICVRKIGKPGQPALHLVGYVKVSAESLEAACLLLPGNPAWEAGATIEVRELPTS